MTLSDCLTDWAGNFTAYPGSHKPIMADLRRIVRSGLLPSTVVKQNKHVFENARQVRARAGDVVMAHHKLAHRGGPNHSAHIRYQIYFRLTHVVRKWAFAFGSAVCVAYFLLRSGIMLCTMLCMYHVAPLVLPLLPLSLLSLIFRLVRSLFWFVVLVGFFWFSIHLNPVVSFHLRFSITFDSSV